MSKYLVSVTENYRVDSEPEVETMLEEAKNDNTFILSKYTSTFKEKKQKGEVIDSWYKVSLTKTFTDEKEPDRQVNISYDNQETGGPHSAF
jgi:hypothetical protein